jgi:hypothetical protein
MAQEAGLVDDFQRLQRLQRIWRYAGLRQGEAGESTCKDIYSMYTSDIYRILQYVKVVKSLSNSWR